MNVHLLTGEAYTPEVCLRDIMEDVSDLESVVVIARYKDGTAQILTSHGNITGMCFAAKVLDRRIYNLLEEAASGR